MDKVYFLKGQIKHFHIIPSVQEKRSRKITQHKALNKNCQSWQYSLQITIFFSLQISVLIEHPEFRSSIQNLSSWMYSFLTRKREQFIITSICPATKYDTLIHYKDRRRHSHNDCIWSTPVNFCLRKTIAVWSKFSRSTDYSQSSCQKEIPGEAIKI